MLIADDNLAEREMDASYVAAHGQAVFAARASPAERRSRGTPDVTAKGVIASDPLAMKPTRPYDCTISGSVQPMKQDVVQNRKLLG